MSSKDRKLREKEEVRNKIIAAARQIAIEEGWHAVTIRKIADKIDYTPPIVYEHFENKEDLFQEIIYYGFGILTKQLDKMKKDATDIKSFLRSISMGHWDFALNYYDLYQLMFNLERAKPNKEMEYGFNVIQDTFVKIAHNDINLARELSVYWASLSHGAISLLKFASPPPDEIKIDKREVYLKIINRFIDSL